MTALAPRLRMFAGPLCKRAFREEVTPLLQIMFLIYSFKSLFILCFLLWIQHVSNH